MSKPCIFGKITGSIHLLSCYSHPLARNFAIPSLKFPTSLHEQQQEKDLNSPDQKEEFEKQQQQHKNLLNYLNT